MLVEEKLPEVALEDGLIVRPPRYEDLPACVKLANTCSMDVLGINDAKLEDFQSGWNSPGNTPELNTRLVTTAGGQLIGDFGVWSTAPHVDNYIWGRVHPDYKGRGISTKLMGWVEGRARQFIAKAPPEAQVAMQAFIPNAHQEAAGLLQNLDFALIRHFFDMKIEMDGPPPQAIWPEGIGVRSMILDQDERPLFEASEEAFRDHWGYVERPAEEEYERWLHWIKNKKDLDPDLWFMAVEGEEIVGISLCMPDTPEDPEMGWVDELAVRRPWRRRGVALALLHHTFAEFYRRGTRKVGLGVDASSLTGATRLYEKAGMHIHRQFDIYKKELRPGKDLSTQSL